MVTLQLDAMGEGKVARGKASPRVHKSPSGVIEVLSLYCFGSACDVPSDLM